MVYLGDKALEMGLPQDTNKMDFWSRWVDIDIRKCILMIVKISLVQEINPETLDSLLPGSEAAIACLCNLPSYVLFWDNSPFSSLLCM